MENAQKLGVLSLSEHGLNELPAQLFDVELVKKLRTLDLSKNNLSDVSRLGMLTELKLLNLDNNNLLAGSLNCSTKLTKLQSLSLSGNKLGKPVASKTPNGATSRPNVSVDVFPALPTSLKQLNISSNFLSHIPRSIISASLNKLEKLDLSSNQLATVPDTIGNLGHLEELRLDSNMIVTLPEAIGKLSHLKVLSLCHNQLQIKKSTSADKNDIQQQQQPFPKSLFTDTSLIDLNLHGNRLTNTEMNQLEGYQEFLDRRQKIKSKTMSNFDVCGLE